MTTNWMRAVRSALVSLAALGWVLLAAAPAAAATTFVVNNAGDTLGTGVGSGVCETAIGNGICTLRRAVAEASVLMPPGGAGALPEVSIVITVPLVTITPAAAAIPFTGRGMLNILGAGASATTIEASSTNLFDFSGSIEKSVRIAGVTIVHALTTVNGTGTLALDAVTLGNSGTVLRWTAGPVTITGSTIRDNDGTAVHGSAVLLTGAPSPAPRHRIRRTTFRGNTGIRGGAVELVAGDLEIEGTTFSANVGTRGGALYVDATATLHATKTTFALNRAAESGGALYMNGKAASPATAGLSVLAHVTLADNLADADQNGSGTGGGIAVTSGTVGVMADVRLTHTLIMGNNKMIFTTFWLATPSECLGPLTLTGPNMFGIVDCALSGPSPIVADALFLPLQFNGGQTQTMVPGIGSPAIDAGAPAPCLSAYGDVITRDQRNHVMPAAATACDIGAVEKDTTPVITAEPYDLDGDRRSDLVWRNRASGQNASWQMNGGTVASAAFLTPVGDLGYTIVASDDLDGDGYADLVWRHSNGTNAVWLMRGSTILEGWLLPSLTDSPTVRWRLAGTGDLDADAHRDLVWEQLTLDVASGTFISAGKTTVWLMDGSAVKGVRPQPDLPNWQLVGIGDANRDGTSDLLWRELGSGGGTALWLMADAAMTSTNALPSVTESGWAIVGFADVDGDDRADIVWRNTENIGSNALWLMDGPTLVGGGYLPDVSPWAWTLVHVQDIDGDNKADFVWRATTGQNAWWRLNGMTLIGGGLLFPVADPNWEIK